MQWLFFDESVYRSAFSVFANFFVISVIVSLILWAMAIALERPYSIENAFVALSMLVSVALLGGLAGYAGGNSRVGVVGDVIPAVLAFLGGAVLYFFGLQRQPALITPFLLSAFVVMIFLGFGMGAKSRQIYDLGVERRLNCISVFSNADVLASDIAVRHAIELFGERCGSVVDLP